MSDAIATGPVVSLVAGLLQQHLAALPCTTLAVLMWSDTGWAGWAGVGAEEEAARHLFIPRVPDHPVVMAIHREDQPQLLPPFGMDDLFAHHCWKCLPLGAPGTALDDEASDPPALLLGFSPASAWHTHDEHRFAQLGHDVGLVLAGMAAERQEPRETDQLALLMRYAANPIILSDRSAIISMNEPAARLFDVSPARDPEEQHEQVGIIARNLKQLRAFLAEADGATDVSTGDLRLEDPLTQEELIMAIVASHVPQALGGQTGTVSVLHDMTRARELEQHRIREQLFESEKLAATGRLAASIAHEINNPLEAIKNSLYLLVRQIPADDPNRQFLELARRETERVSRIIRQMLGVSRPSVTFMPTNVNEIIQDVLQLLGPQLRQGCVTLTVQLDEHLPQVRASTDQLKQVFLNLLLNARQAMPNGGGLLVQSRMAHEGDAEFLAGKHVIVRIRDDGLGIPSEILPHVFEPFFSTKADRQGTGLGLWVCQDIIQHHGGHIIARSMVGRGSTFLVALPFIAAGEGAAA